MKFIGTKLINAIPMNREEYNHMRGWVVPADEEPLDEGYLVEYLDGGKANVEGFKGYVSWSPRDVFEGTYKPVQGMDFGDAIRAMKLGQRVARAGWNGKGMWLALSCPDTKDVPTAAFWNQHNAQHARDMGGTAKVLPSFTMKTATNEILMGWLASQTDMLATDWQVV